MKNILFLFLLFTGIANAQIVTIPDANFKAKLLAASASLAIASTSNSATIPNTYNKIDVNNDGQIQQSEAANVTLLDVGGASNIADLTGIAAFVNLRVLRCYGNQLSSLNIDALNSLVILECNNNNITSLSITNKTFLQSLFCNNNQLTNLTLSNLPSLANLYCGNNFLTSLNISSFTQLALFGCENNQLPALDVSNLTHLLVIQCENNFIASLDTSGLNNLQYLSCQNNLLTSLLLSSSPDISSLNCANNNLTSLSYNGTSHFGMFNCSNNAISNISISGAVTINNLSCQINQISVLDLSDVQLLTVGNFTINPITVLNIKNGFIENFTNYSITPGMANLIFICADDNELSQLDTYLNTALLFNPNIVINSYCSFTPGGDYNTITGTIKYDANADGCGVSDAVQPNIRVNITDGTNQGATFTYPSGIYNFYTQAGNFDLNLNIENPAFFNISPATTTIAFANANNNTTIQDFCITPNGIHPDVEVVIEPVAPARPGFDATYRVVYKNKGNQTVTGAVSLLYNDSVLDFVSASPAPNTTSTGAGNWYYSNLLPFESRHFLVTLNVNSSIETPAVNINDVLNFNAYVTPITGDAFPADNSFAYNQTVVGAFDPNNIRCIEGAVVPPSQIGNYLHYVINFENTGNYQAENVVVSDIIDTNKYDINSLQLLNTSHSAYTRMNGNTIEFIFENINLAAAAGDPPVGGHGNILFKIRSKSNLAENDYVSKNAKIYFDYNAPINTNLAQTTFQALNNSVFESDTSVVVHPNPTSGILQVKSDFIIQSMQLYDIQGRLLETDLQNAAEATMDISTHQTGIYFLKINTEKGSKVEKIMKK